jgi:hypothetical protein
MPKVADLKAYYRDLAVKAGLGEDEIKQVTAVMENEKFAKAFTEGFKPLPDYSHDLDDVRTRTEAEKDSEYQAWHEQELQKYNEYQAGLDRLRAYEAQYGPLDAAQRQQVITQTTAGGNMLTKEDIDRLKAEIKSENDSAFARRDQAVLELLDVRENHMNTFKKSMDVKAFEAAWKDHPEWGGTIRQAYKEYIAPEMDKIREAQIKSEADRRYEEGVRDGFSLRATPTDHQPKSFSPMFDREVTIDKMNEGEQEKHSRQSFFEGLQEKTPA